MTVGARTRGTTVPFDHHWGTMLPLTLPSTHIICTKDTVDTEQNVVSAHVTKNVSGIPTTLYPTTTNIIAWASQNLPSALYWLCHQCLEFWEDRYPPWKPRWHQSVYPNATLWQTTSAITQKLGLTSSSIALNFGIHKLCHCSEFCNGLTPTSHWILGWMTSEIVYNPKIHRLSFQIQFWNGRLLLSQVILWASMPAMEYRH